MKIFHFKEKLDSLSEDIEKIIPPIHIRIKPTNFCNHNCRYCAYRIDNVQLGKDMKTRDFIPREKMLQIIDDIKEMGVQAVTFSGGGEPLCYPYILDAVKELSKSIIKFAVLTNGSNLTGEIAEIFSLYGAWARISIDGWDDQSYSDYRNVPLGEFAKVMRNIKNFKKLRGKCRLGISLIVDKSNAIHIYEFCKKLKDAGVDSIKISACIISNNAVENNNYHKPIFNRVKDELKKAEIELKDKDFEISDAYHELDCRFKKDYNWCPYLQILPVIGADQNVYSCQDKAYNLDEGLLGSIKHMRFKDFWLSDKNKFFKIDPTHHCNHHCVANAKNQAVLEYLNADKEHLGFV